MTALFSDPAAAAKKQANMARVEEAMRQQSVTAGTDAINNTFSQFNDGFFGKQQQGYIDFAQPQLDDQYGKAKQQLTYALARSGSLDSSTRAAQEADLQQKYNTAQQGIRDQGLSYANQTRNNVEGARSDLLTALNSSADATGAANGTISRATALSQPQAYSPLGQIFGDAASAFSTQAAAERATGLAGGYVGGNTTYRSPFDTGLFSKASSVVTRN